MSLFDKFRKKQDTQPGKAPEKTPAVSAVAPKKQEQVKDDAATTPKKHTTKSVSATSTSKKSDKNKASSQMEVSHIAHRILLKPIVSEKSAHLNSVHQYVFKVSLNANKVEIKQAIKEMYKVEPESVRVIRVSGKYVKRGLTIGRTSEYKKAIVRMPKGVELPIYEGV